MFVGADDPTVYAVTVTSVARTVSCVSARININIYKLIQKELSNNFKSDNSKSQKQIKNKGI